MINLFTKRMCPPGQGRGRTSLYNLVVQAAISLLLILPFHATSQDIATLTKEAEKLEITFREYDALQKYKEVLRHQPTNLNALCRASDLCSRIGHREQDKAKRADYYKAAKTYAEVALKINPQSAEANFVMAVAMGRMAMISSGKEKV